MGGWASERPVSLMSGRGVAEALKSRGHRAAAEIASAADLADRLKDLVAPGDIVVCLGAGDITKWAAGLASDIAARRDRPIASVAGGAA
jgi:UDP-N-acetylmuramate--alanine ligase